MSISKQERKVRKLHRKFNGLTDGTTSFVIVQTTNTLDSKEVRKRRRKKKKSREKR